MLDDSWYFRWRSRIVLYILFLRQCGHTEGVLTVRGYPSRPAFSQKKTTQNGSYCEMSICISTAQARTKRVSRSWGARHFSCKFSHQKTLMTCPCAFRRRKLAQNGCRGPGVYGIFPVNFQTTWLWWHVHMHFDCAGSHKTRHLIQKSLTSYRELVERSCQETSYRDLVQRHCIEICCRDLANISSQEGFYRELVQRSHEEILPRSCRETS